MKRLTSTGINIIRRHRTDIVHLHLHDFYELELIISGTAEQNLNGTVYELKPGSVTFMTPIDFHSITPHGELEMVNLTFDESYLTPQMQQMFMNRRENFFFQSDGHTIQSMQTLLELMLQQSEIQDEYSAIYQSHLLDLILYTLARLGATSIRSDNAADSHQIQQSIQYLFRHFREDITLEDVALRSGYTPNYFSKLFHDYSGEKFMDFLIKLRLNYAKMLLISTQLPMSVVAEKSGFGSAYNLYRRMQKACDLSPTQFREQYKSQTK